MIKAEVILELTPEHKEYPVLKRYKNNYVVLFSSPEVGVVVAQLRVYDDDEMYADGHFSDTWQEGQFEEFTGTISLKNS